MGFGACFDELNLTNPALVAEIHRDYIEAGAQIVLSNTFGANRYKLAEHGLEAQVAEINRAGVELARRVVLASFKDVLVAGDVGPLGVRLVPFGRVTKEEARAAFAEQIVPLAEAGADLIVIETLSDLSEMSQAIKATQQVCDLPIIASMTFTRDDRTLLGDAPAKVARRLSDAGRGRDRRELFRRAGATAAHRPADAGGGAGWAVLGQAERGMAGAERRADYVSGDAGVLR